jgi:hypothetical protein
MMKLLQSYMTEGGAYIAMEEDGSRYRAFLLYGKNEVRRVVAKHVPRDSNTAIVLADLDRVPMPETASSETVEIEGTFVLTLSRMASYAMQMADGRLMRFTSDLRATVCSFFASDDPGVRDALIGFVDDAAEHHIVVIFSKEQGEAIVDGMRGWLPKDKRRQIKRSIASSGLPKRSSRQVIDLCGILASSLNCAYMLQKASAAEPAH